jgi:hypothetical protein
LKSGDFTLSWCPEAWFPGSEAKKFYKRPVLLGGAYGTTIEVSSQEPLRSGFDFAFDHGDTVEISRFRMQQNLWPAFCGKRKSFAKGINSK